MNDLEKVYIHALCNVYYDSFYIKGIQEMVGKKNIIFNTSLFPDFKQNTFAAIFKFNEKEIRVIIDSRDTSELWEKELEWCDIYGKVNYNSDTIINKDKLKKIITIGPSFGIKIWNLYETVYLGLKHSLNYTSQITNQREYLANYWRQYKRLELKKYFESFQIIPKYVFFISSIWKKEKTTNSNRLNFIKACTDVRDIVFEGGFAPRKDKNNLGLDTYLSKKRYKLEEYILKTKQSEFVFNTPAVLDCHGWKLAEFLALGKAIITTSHINKLPNKLLDYQHVIYVDNAESISSAINMLIKDNDLKSKLEYNSRKYFDEYLNPKRVIENLITLK